jgi:hypothetical protein
MKYSAMNELEKKTMPICFTADQLELIEVFSKKRGMFNLGQAIEDIIKKTNSQKLSQTSINQNSSHGYYDT